jgi:tRNA-dihydrouridine synthase B
MLSGDGPVLALAPMQDVTDWAFWKLMARYGGADLYFTEYFRVTECSRLDRKILRSITDNPTGRPAIAQMIGNDIPALVRTAKELQKHPIAAIDLNLGCPAPVVYRKCAGGGLLRDPERVDRILGALRKAIAIPFTVKTRVGFDSWDGFDDLLAIFAKHSLDLLTVHGRTVLEMYRPGVHYDLIAKAVRAMPCPVLANGGMDSAVSALKVIEETGARGVMIGRGVIRNPWMFDQIRAMRRGETVREPSGTEVLDYVRELYAATLSDGIAEGLHVQKMKKYMNFIGAGIGAEFLHDIRRVSAAPEFFEICERWLAHSRPMPLLDEGY